MQSGQEKKVENEKYYFYYIYTNIFLYFYIYKVVTCYIVLNTHWIDKLLSELQIY